MKINKSNIEARKLLYTEFLSKWVWNNKEKIWTLRQACHTIGRIYYIHPNSGELYYLRLLLNPQKGGTRYESLHTINNIVYPTQHSKQHVMY